MVIASNESAYLVDNAGKQTSAAAVVLVFTR
jgi:hypothetical protein